MTEKLEPGYYQTVDGAQYRWERQGPHTYVREFRSAHGSEWQPAMYLFISDIKADRDALDALIAHEQEEQDWVELGPYRRCLRDGTSPQWRISHRDEWMADDRSAHHRTSPFLTEAYRLGYENGKEDG